MFRLEDPRPVLSTAGHIDRFPVDLDGPVPTYGNPGGLLADQGPGFWEPPVVPAGQLMLTCSHPEGTVSWIGPHGSSCWVCGKPSRAAG